MFLMRAGEGNPLKLFERFGSHLLGYPVLLAVVFAVMYLLLRVLRRRTAVPAGHPARPAGAGRFICELSVSFHFPA